MSDLIHKLRAGTQVPCFELRQEAADEIERLQRHLSRVLYLYQGAWHPNSILAQEHGHEIAAAHTAAMGRKA